MKNVMRPFPYRAIFLLTWAGMAGGGERGLGWGEKECACESASDTDRLCVWTYVYMCTLRICAYAHTHICTLLLHTHICTLLLHTHVCTLRIRACMQATRTDFVYAHTHICLRITLYYYCTYAYMHFTTTYAYMHFTTYAHMFTHNTCTRAYGVCMPYRRLCVRARVRVCACARVRVCACARVHVCAYVCTLIHIHTHTNTHTCISTFCNERQEGGPNLFLKPKP